MLVNQINGGCSHHASCTYHNEVEIDLLGKETVNSVTWKYSELLLKTRMLFHTERVKENKEDIMGRQLEKNQDDGVPKATYNSRVIKKASTLYAVTGR